MRMLRQEQAALSLTTRTVTSFLDPSGVRVCVCVCVHAQVATDAYVAPRAASTGAQQIQPQLLGRFWTLVVEEGLLKSSNERKYLAMQLFLVRVYPHTHTHTHTRIHTCLMRAHALCMTYASTSTHV